MSEMCYEEIKELISRLLNNKENAIAVGIDGRCASGKTKLSEKLKKEFNASVIHMDDFFLPRELRTKERLSSPGGNVHYERFETEVLERLRLIKSGIKAPFSYKRFDCSLMDFQREPVLCPAARLYIVEGAYSMRPELSDIYDLKIFSDISHELQIERIMKRNGPNALPAFIEKWIPMEEKYFDFYKIKENCDAVFNSYKSNVI